MTQLCDHFDVRVRDREAARRFYDPFCATLGLTRVAVDDEWITYTSDDPTGTFLGITTDAQHRPNGTRIALRAVARADVDRIAAAARDAGARSFEPPQVCPEYSPGYYASFFEDPDGNAYEVCSRASATPLQ